MTPLLYSTRKFKKPINFLSSNEAWRRQYAHSASQHKAWKKQVTARQTNWRSLEKLQFLLGRECSWLGNTVLRARVTEKAPLANRTLLNITDMFCKISMLNAHSSKPLDDDNNNKNKNNNNYELYNTMYLLLLHRNMVITGTRQISKRMQMLVHPLLAVLFGSNAGCYR